ncbi:putative LRR receptor-like serine/threonine-protein kinase [Vitis vinifera]|uniref:non-specific serine/threonine protein kinase n=1 Tax=Vitis vinifera TaxID=29760 RepID=A0A438FQJ3_VITVI|nr:putative LRR receptor-like serine/threonine-protein kinase [Vitis vinifera]
MSGELIKALSMGKESFGINDVGHNALSGTIPKELGNLKELQMFFIDSSGVGGEIPSTFLKLKNMREMFLSDTPLTGKIPDFIGNWTKLKRLRIQGNSFEGPIPSTFSQLISMESLRISDLANVSSSLDFIKDMKNLTDLVLRNALISGGIPSDIEEYRSLETLDLSFNNLTGGIPNALFKMNNLTALFLGNNSFYGSLPDKKSDKLQTIDLSYNEISGGFPTWIDSTLHLNLVANNFVFDNTNNRTELSSEELPCNTPRYTNVSIKCGGQEVTTPDGMVYESDNSILGTASTSYYVSRSEKWAVSNVGLYVDRIANTSSLVNGTDTPELFKTSRISPGSLRYYGLGLKNGPYVVSLQFAEMLLKDPSTRTWESTGRRVFDIYIQGALKEKDFDISKEAGGVQRAIVKKFNATVSKNYLEIHLLWAASERMPPPPSETSNTGLIAGIAVTAELLEIGPISNTFSYAELRTATENFNPTNKLGEGGFGAVFKDLMVASQQGKSQFIAEIATISAVQHRNLVKLHGFCIKENKRLLVYEYLENKSLDRALFGKSDLHLDWPTRFNICLGTARGLAYLHEESRARIVHRDVKASNILLDAELCPKISDFGLAKLYDDKKTHISTRVAGTIGYLAPEYAMRGHLTEKADVFGFGVVALEILSGRPNSDNSLDARKMYLLEWAWTLHENNQSMDLVDPTLTEFDENEVSRVMRVALLCTQGSPMLRPAMSRVVAMLAGGVEISAVTSKPSYLTDWDFNDITSSFLSENTQTSTASTSMTDQLPSPIYHAEPMLLGVIGEGR